jgi:release factor glutamine methyltransferase
LIIDAASTAVQLNSMVARRVAGEPLEHVLGWVEFCGERVAVEPGVFVPRRRSELLVDVTVGLLEGPDPVVVDLCCGCGAIGRAVARRAEVELHASDIDPAGVRCARRNLDGLGTVHEGDLFDALPDDLRGRIDVVVVNAPYVPTDAIASMPPEARDHEPRVALDGGSDGVEVHRRVIAGALAWLRAGAHLVIETGREQSVLTVAAMERAGLTARVVIDDDLDGTAVVGVRR